MRAEGMLADVWGICIYLYVERPNELSDTTRYTRTIPKRVTMREKSLSDSCRVTWVDAWVCCYSVQMW
jgi:hypothetical protein